MNMRTSIASALALALALPPPAAHAGGWSPEQQATMQRIMALRNGGALDDAVTLAQQQFARTDTSKGFRRAVAREGKAAAVQVFERDRDTPRASAAVVALCVAVDLMRTYQAELMESEDDRVKIPLEVTRLEGLATAAAAPCAPASAPPPDPADPPVVADVKVQPVPGPSVEGPPSASPIRRARQRSRARVGVGVGLVTLGTGFLVGMTAAFVARHNYNEKIAVLKGEQANRDLTTQEVVAISSWDARYVQLERTGAVLGGLAAVSVVTAIVVFMLPKRPATSQARVRPVGAGVLIRF